MLTIMACIKFVPTELAGDYKSSYNYSVNPYDLFMLEQLLYLKRKLLCRISAVTMGPRDCYDSLKRLIAMGLDDVYLVSDKCFAGSDTYATSYILYNAIKHIGTADIYAFGEKSVDGETGQVPIGISSHLGILCYTGIEEMDVLDEEKVILKRRTMKNIENIKIIKPYAICFKGFTTKEPDISLLKMKQSQDYIPRILDSELLKIDKKHCGQNGSKTKVVNAVNNINIRNSERIEGTMAVKTDYLQKLMLGGKKIENKYLDSMF